jgi:hypothetical protein
VNKFLSILFLLNISLSQVSLAFECPNELSKSHLLGKVSNPTKFYTPSRDFCTDEALNVFSNCIETDRSSKTLFFGSRDRHSEPQQEADCPNGYAPEVRSGFLKFQKLNGKPVCLDPCESVAVGKFFRDEDRFGFKKSLSVGDKLYIPELKGLQCGDKVHKGCVTVTQFIEYTPNPAIDVYFGVCRNIIKGLCRDYNDQKLPDTFTIYKINLKTASPMSESQLSSKNPGELQNYLLNF